MLEAMRELALEFLREQLSGQPGETAEETYRRIREQHSGRLFPFLVEASDESGEGDAARYYTLSADPDDAEVAVLCAHELKEGDGTKLPFNQPSGSQSPALGPVIKRSAAAKGKPPGPSEKIRETTLQAFREIGTQGKPWSPYFGAAAACWSRPKLRFGADTFSSAGNAYAEAVGKISEKRTVLLAYRDATGRLPGEVPEYVEYLQQVLAATKYTTGSNPARENQVCPLCGAAGVKVYPNALRGAGINLGNLDRDGAFAGIDPEAAWKSFAPCLACADLLYVYCRHVANKFATEVAGERALCVPTLNSAAADRAKLFERLRTWAASATPVGPGKDAVPTQEKRLLNHLVDERALNSITFVWATFGQRIDDVRGVVTDVLPSRLAAIATANKPFNDPNSDVNKNPLFPKVALTEFGYDLSLSLLRPLLSAGGKKAKRDNESRRLFDLRRDVADAVYRTTPLPVDRFWDEIHTTARWHWDEAMGSDAPTYGLLREGWSAKNKEGFLTLAGWVRQLAKFLHYCRTIGALPMPDPKDIYRPNAEVLKPYFGPESGIDTPAKAFAFILGALYGKLLAEQHDRDVNVGANALTWLHRLTLAGRDLPELYVKVREKLMVYGTEWRDENKHLRDVVTELGTLGAKLGTAIPLDETDACYFLLIGQSLALRIMPK